MEFESQGDFEKSVIDEFNKISHPKQLYIGLDTNALYNRSISSIFPIADHNNSIEANNCNFIISSIVSKELDLRIKDKYNENDIRILRKIVNNPSHLIKFNNQRKLTSRRAGLALVEENTLISKFGAQKIKKTGFSDDKEKNDILIAESYEEFQDKNSAKVSVLTFDQEMGNHATNHELTPIVLRQKTDLESVNNDFYYERIANLIHSIACVFGVIQLTPAGVTIYGVWGGKDRGSDNYNENLLLKLENDSLATKLKQDLMAQHKIESIGLV